MDSAHQDRRSVEELADRLAAEGIDWEAAHRAQPYRAPRRAGRFGL